MTDSSSSTPVSRRTVLASAAALGAAGALVGCGPSAPSTPAAVSGPVTVPTAQVPVGGGTILQDSQLVVTQPEAGTFKAFSAICTHQGCLVGSVANGTITCPCHNSAFSATDGSVKNGPATTPLTAKTVKVDGSNLDIS